MWCLVDSARYLSRQLALSVYLLQVMADISEFVLVLSQNVDQIKSMYEELAIDCEYKV